MVWKTKQLGGGKEFLMRAHFGLPSVKSEDTVDRRTPISIKFEIPYFTVSGIQVRYLKIVEKSGYQALRKYCPPVASFMVSERITDVDMVRLSSFFIARTAWVRYITQHGEYDLRTQSEKPSARLAPFSA